MEAKLKKCVFVRYGIDEFGQRIWDFENLKIVRSGDVIFNEKVLYKDLLQQHEKKEDDYVVLDDTPKDVFPAISHVVPAIPHDPRQPQQKITHPIECQTVNKAKQTSINIFLFFVFYFTY